METIVKHILHALFFGVLVLVNAFLGWYILDEFDLSFTTWFGMAIVGISIVRAGTALDHLWDYMDKNS